MSTGSIKKENPIALSEVLLSKSEMEDMLYAMYEVSKHTIYTEELNRYKAIIQKLIDELHQYDLLDMMDRRE